jgi:NADH-ubiquinone oxidoreductase chain 2
LAFSSVHHLGWVLLPLAEGRRVWGVYFLVYFIISRVVVRNLRGLRVFNLNQISKLNFFSLGGLSLVVRILSLGGLPPLLGFAPKYFLLQTISTLRVSVGLYIIRGLSVILLYVYLRLVIRVILLRHLSPLKFRKLHFSWERVCGLFLNLLGAFGRGLIFYRFLQ